VIRAQRGERIIILYILKRSEANRA